MEVSQSHMVNLTKIREKLYKYISPTTSPNSLSFIHHFISFTLKSYRRPLGIGMILRVPTDDYPDHTFQLVRVNVGGQAGSSYLAPSDFVTELKVKQKLRSGLRRSSHEMNIDQSFRACCSSTAKYKR